jgi:hypothetical protein
MRSSPGLLIALMVWFSPAFAESDRSSCDLGALTARFDRAWEARDDYFFWEGIDDREATTDLERTVARLQSFLEVHAICGSKEIDDLARRAQRQVARAKQIARRE